MCLKNVPFVDRHFMGTHFLHSDRSWFPKIESISFSSEASLMRGTICTYLWVEGWISRRQFIFILIKFGNMIVIGSPLWSMTSPVMESWLVLQYQIWVSTYWVGRKSNLTALGHPQGISATMAQPAVVVICRTYIWVGLLITVPYPRHFAQHPPTFWNLAVREEASSQYQFAFSKPYNKRIILDWKSKGHFLKQEPTSGYLSPCLLHNQATQIIVYSIFSSSPVISQPTINLITLSPVLNPPIKPSW